MRLIFIISVSILAISPLTSPFAYGVEHSPLVYPTDSSPFGIPFSQWIINWWQWNVGIPVKDHPNTNYTSEKCSRGQIEDSPVWFLALPFSEEQVSDRTCTIPKEKAILTALLSGIIGYSDPGIDSDEKAKTAVLKGNDYGAIEVSLDGDILKYDMNINRVLTNFFNINYPVDNFFETTPGPVKSVVDGYFLFLKPLSIGQHELKYKIQVLNPTYPEYNYFQEVTYHLIVN